ANDVRPTGRTIAVPPGGYFQAVLKATQQGDVITLEAGATFQGPITLPKKSGTGWIVVRTSAPDDRLSPPGTRVTPASAAVMPKVVVGTGSGGAIVAAPGPITSGSSASRCGRWPAPSFTTWWSSAPEA